MKRDSKFYESVIMEMILFKKSIRDMSKKYNIPKITLHYKLQAAKQMLDEENYLLYEELLISNKASMQSKGGNSIKGKPRKRRNGVKSNEN